MDEKDDDLSLSLSLRCPENLPPPLAMNLMEHPKLPSTNSFDQSSSDGNGEERWYGQRRRDKENGGAGAGEGGEKAEEGAWSPNSTVSSVSGKKNERAERKEEVERSWSSSGDGGLEVRKKLRLSKEQSAVLEGTFKLHSTLNPKQKVSLAKQLNLRPRQVEVWFQNRRARTKLKQTEADCEYLRRCCENVTEENMRLQQEVNELRALRRPHQFYMHTNSPGLTICASCQRVAVSSSPPSPPDAASAGHHSPLAPPHHPPPSNTQTAPP